jgi:glycine oxidase
MQFTQDRSSMDVIIVGGGIIGLLTARELALSGARVAVLERQGIGQESSWAGGGILSPLYPWRVAEPITALCSWSQSAYPELAAALLDSTGIDPEWIRSGLLVNDCEDFEEAVTWCGSRGVKHARLTEQEWAGLEPGLGIPPKDALHLPDIAQIRNPRLLKALHADLTQRRVQLLENQEVLDVAIHQGRVQHIVTQKGKFSAASYVIAAGAWSGVMGRLVALDVQVEPVKGQMLVFNAPPGLLRHIILTSGHYLIPRKDGRILAGSTVEYSAFDKSTTESVRDTLAGFARSVLPALREWAIERHWAGLRPGTIEGIPYIGCHPRIPNLYFNCGHFRNGFVMAPASAHLLADLILNRSPVVAPEPYRVTAAH